MWEIIKTNFTECLFKNLEQLSGTIESDVNQLTEKAIVSGCSYTYFLMFKLDYLNHLLFIFVTDDLR